ncbi:hypothetical protein CDD80_2514 [Ophiocordyceps camponoti-rufipedis]|uniref:Uncharacterized protein n=1 Tax=Ophiocordyceps camponoti-rufipedis TaxID=2004952 RepID=A0A2C5YB12_9HYPO|nr:hypothetical protein CDD80_2514 [Ophiocordyceps camponoti-rufipedis]
MKSTMAMSLLAAATVQAGQAYGTDSSGPAFLNVQGDYDSAKAGQNFNIKLTGCDASCTVIPKQGQAENLQNIPGAPSITVTGSSATLRIPEGYEKVAFVVTDNKGNVNYSPQFAPGGAKQD